MAKNNKGQLFSDNQGADVKKILSDDEIKRLLIFKTDEKSTEKGTDEVFDRVNEKAGLVNDPTHGKIIGPLKGNGPKFFDEFYDPLYRLRNIPKLSNNRRPSIFAKDTNTLMYLRYPYGTLRKLQKLNPKINGKRLFKHYNLLTDLGEIGFDQFMREAITLMNECTYFDEFMSKFAKQYGKPWQLNLFEENN